MAPWYYPAAALANLFLVSCGLIGMILAGAAAMRWSRTAAALYGIATLTFVCQVGFDAFVAVEARFGVPGLMILYVFAGWLLFSSVAGGARRGALSAVAAAATCAAYPLSGWVRRQAPAIVANESAAAQPQKGQAEALEIVKSMNPNGRFISGELSNWSLESAGVGAAGEAVLCAGGAAEYALVSHPVE